MRWGGPHSGAFFLCTMKYQISSKGSATKPSDDEFAEMQWLEKDTDQPTLLDYLGKGHTYRANMANTLNDGPKTLVSTQVIMIDVDGKHNPPTLAQFLELTRLTRVSITRPSHPRTGNVTDWDTRSTRRLRARQNITPSPTSSWRRPVVLTRKWLTPFRFPPSRTSPERTNP